MIEPTLVNQPYISNCRQALPSLLDSLTKSTETQHIADRWMKKTYLEKLKSEVCELTKAKAAPKERGSEEQTVPQSTDELDDKNSLMVY